MCIEKEMYGLSVQEVHPETTTKRLQGRILRPQVVSSECLLLAALPIEPTALTTISGDQKVRGSDTRCIQMQHIV